MVLSEEELRRYSRQLALRNIGLEGQQRLKEGRATIVGMGGLGCVSATQLAAIGVGYMRLIDQDVVEITNLHRQFLYDTSNLGHPKVEVAEKRLKSLNPNVEFEPIPFTVNQETAEQAVEDVDVVIDGLDHLAPRYAINRACVKKGVPYVFGSALEMYGNVSTVLPGKTACLECIFSGEISDEGLPTCETVGVLPPILSIISSIQVREAVDIILNRQPLLANKLIIADANSLSFETFELSKSPTCTTCGSPYVKRKRDISETKVAQLCGKDSYMISPITPLSLSIVDVAESLSKRFRIKVQTGFGVTFDYSDAVSISLMKTGNALIKGTPSKDAALKAYNDVMETFPNR